jgi:hypothetical protein
MAPIRKGVTEFIRAGKSLFEMTNLSPEEDQAIQPLVSPPHEVRIVYGQPLRHMLPFRLLNQYRHPQGVVLYVSFRISNGWAAHPSNLLNRAGPVFISLTQLFPDLSRYRSLLLFA